MLARRGWQNREKAPTRNRGLYLETCREVIVAARSAEGCIDFHVSADALDEGRINVFEQWRSAEAVDAFRGSGPNGDQQMMILDAHVEQHEVVSTTSLM